MTVDFPPIIVFLQIFNAVAAPHISQNQTLRCIFSRASSLDDWEQLADDIAKGAENAVLGLDQVDPFSVRCTDPDAHCVAIWAEVGNQTEMLLQGCWDVTQDVCSSSDICSSGDRVFQPSRNGFPSYMCCCRARNCNRIERVVVGPLDPQISKNSSKDVKNFVLVYKRDFRVSALLLIASAISVLLLLLVVRRCWTMNRNPEKRRQIMNAAELAISAATSLQSRLESGDTGLLLEEKDPFLSSIHLLEQIGSGYFAVIYRALSGVGEVAVKVYQKDSSMLINEYDILTLLEPVNHPNIVKVIPCSKLGHSLVMELCLCSLHTLLEERALTITEFFDCAMSVNDGLAFLHSHNNGGAAKSVIAHRDLNPHNILVKNRDSLRVQLCIADFGLAVVFHGGRLTNGTLELTERGTVRYMAPELVEGSINLLDPMTSLLQTDVYACALVLWELLWRCKDIWPPNKPPAYRIAFDDMVPRDPQLEHMYPIVVRNRRRPDVPTAAQNRGSSSLPGLCDLWSFITDMWEHEPEGRTTAACTADRLRRLRQIMNPAGVADL